MTDQSGWYVDQYDNRFLRYFDGTTWTEHRAIRNPPAQATVPVKPAPAVPDLNLAKTQLEDWCKVLAEQSAKLTVLIDQVPALSDEDPLFEFELGHAISIYNTWVEIDGERLSLDSSCSVSRGIASVTISSPSFTRTLNFGGNSIRSLDDPDGFLDAMKQMLTDSCKNSNQFRDWQSAQLKILYGELETATSHVTLAALAELRGWVGTLPRYKLSVPKKRLDKELERYAALRERADQTVRWISNRTASVSDVGNSRMSASKEVRPARGEADASVPGQDDLRSLNIDSQEFREPMEGSRRDDKVVDPTNPPTRPGESPDGGRIIEF